MRDRRLVGMAYAEDLGAWGWYNKVPCLCADISKQYSQHQRYPMVLDVFERTKTEQIQ